MRLAVAAHLGRKRRSRSRRRAACGCVTTHTHTLSLYIHVRTHATHAAKWPKGGSPLGEPGSIYSFIHSSIHHLNLGSGHPSPRRWVRDAGTEHVPKKRRAHPGQPSAWVGRYCTVGQRSAEIEVQFRDMGIARVYDQLIDMADAVRTLQGAEAVWLQLECIIECAKMRPTASSLRFSSSFRTACRKEERGRIYISSSGGDSGSSFKFWVSIGREKI